MNVEYFDGMLGRPQLGWSRGSSRSMLGHFDPSHNAIIISRIFDRKTVPALALEYVMYHEMLHLRFPVDHTGARRRVHTKEFREAERNSANLKRGERTTQAALGAGRHGGGHQVAKFDAASRRKSAPGRSHRPSKYPSDTGKDGNTQPAFRTRT